MFRTTIEWWFGWEDKPDRADTTLAGAVKPRLLTQLGQAPIGATQVVSCEVCRPYRGFQHISQMIPGLYSPGRGCCDPPGRWYYARLQRC
jgi:hypothetical protein